MTFEHSGISLTHSPSVGVFHGRDVGRESDGEQLFGALGVMLNTICISYLAQEGNFGAAEMAFGAF